MRFKGIGTRKLTDRLIIALAFSVILIIILLIFHINLYIQMSKTLLENPRYDQTRPIVKQADFKK